MKKIIPNLFLAALSGVLGFLAFPPFELHFLAWVCLVPLLFAVRRSGGNGGAFWYSYFAGVVFFGGLLSWLINVTVPGTVTTVLLMAVFYGLFGLIARMVAVYSLELFVLPFVWVVMEYMRTYVATGFPWGLLGYSQYLNIKLIQIADITGAYGISFMIAAVNAAFFSFFIRDKRRIFHLASAMAIIVFSSVYGAHVLNNFAVRGTAKLAVVQGNIPQNFKWDAEYAEAIIKKYTLLTREAAAAGEADIIIWPETAYPYLMDAGDDAEELRKLASEIKVPLLAGAVCRGEGGYYNSAVLFSDKGEVADKYYKIHLVPFGEYIPFGKYLAPFRRYIDKPIGDYAKGEMYTLFPLRSSVSPVADENRIIRSTNFYKIGVLICFEDIFPDIARDFVKRGADILVNMTNDAWFGDTAASRQHLQASVLRAVENRVPVVRAANTGISCFIDPTGEILSRVQQGGKDTFVDGYGRDTVRLSYSRSFYTRTNGVFVLYSGLVMVFFFAVEIFQARRGGGKGWSANIGRK